MSCRNIEVNQWLKELFKGEDIPPFEETEEDMELLMKIMNKNKECEKDKIETILIKENLVEMYDKKSDEISALLDNVNLPLSVESLDRVENIASVANDLHLKEPSLTNFFLAIPDVENKKIKNQEEELILDHHIATLNRKLSKTRKINETLKRELEVLEEVITSQAKMQPQVKANASFLKTKTNGYTSRIKEHEQYLTDIGCEPSLYHNQLVQKSKEIEELKKNVQILEEKLLSYQNLPPSEALTRMKIQETEAELLTMEEEFDKLLQQV